MVAAFGSVNEFMLCKNQLTDTENIDPSKLGFMQETSFLNLEEVGLTSFEGLKAFSTLPHLEKLILNKNPIGTFGRDITGFVNLTHLSVQQCEISKPVVLYEFSAFKNV